MGKLYESPKSLHQKGNKNSYRSKFNESEKNYSFSHHPTIEKKFDYPDRYRSAEKQIKKGTFIDQLSEKKLIGERGKSIDYYN